MTGRVYFMQCADTLRIKIGWSADVEGRLRALNDGSSTLVELLATTPGTKQDEAMWHKKYAVALVDHIASREWFYPVPPLLDDIRGLGGRPRTGAVVPGVTWSAISAVRVHGTEMDELRGSMAASRNVVRWAYERAGELIQNVLVLAGRTPRRVRYGLEPGVILAPSAAWEDDLVDAIGFLQPLVMDRERRMQRERLSVERWSASPHRSTKAG